MRRGVSLWAREAKAVFLRTERAQESEFYTQKEGGEDIPGWRGTQMTVWLG